ncbi:thiol reductant ABC exporter subunit CydD [Methylopila jiangsuensis]|uniref:Thiol reductant ABC exporter subunit CydD n=1 Tax=Methylopila jiangsuensis TaxID=586230 RepID=A0A9W6JFU8_9HYPH|nr:thiol reductant ABC exporter subunit CydD [Methylopila jiangsuensis]MDR6285339.1 ATP-binding cassette subfamily C protein CydD [Methylopila jiangsuensis]GLK75095.1 thiol reductant ABC exporter subunit CydD [Methylopila jiangsuensis]
MTHTPPTTDASPEPGRSRPRASLALWLQAAAALMWLPQAAALALGVGRIAEGGGATAMLAPAAALIGFGALRAGLDAAGQRLAFRDARAELSRLRFNATRALAARSPLDAGRAPSGLAASVLAEQAEAVTAYVARFQPARFKATAVPLVILACVAPLSWLAALILMAAAPLIPLFMALVGWRAKAASERQFVAMGEMNGFLLDRLRGLDAIRSAGAVEATAQRVRAEADGLRRRAMAVLRIAFLSSAVLELFSALGVALVAVYVGFNLLGQIPFGAWGGRLSLPEGLFVLLLAPAFFEPLRELSAAWHDRASGQAALEALERLAAPGRMALPGAVDEPAFAPPFGPAPVVRLKGLRFAHDGAERPALDGFSLVVAPGERVAVLGPSGTGKSTLLALIAGLAPAAGGRILIGGAEMTPDTAAALRARMVWIGQTPHVFSGSLSRNVRLGRPDIGRVQAERALRATALGPLLDRRGDAAVGENGLGLSGGETLRLALARLAVAPGATLVLADEPTAHLDRETARQIMDALIALSAGRTLIVATHDPELAARMDRIVRFDDARLEDAA